MYNSIEDIFKLHPKINYTLIVGLPSNVIKLDPLTPSYVHLYLNDITDEHTRISMVSYKMYKQNANMDIMKTYCYYLQENKIPFVLVNSFHQKYFHISNGNNKMVIKMYNVAYNEVTNFVFNDIDKKHIEIYKVMSLI